MGYINLYCFYGFKSDSVLRTTFGIKVPKRRGEGQGLPQSVAQRRSTALLTSQVVTLFFTQQPLPTNILGRDHPIHAYLLNARIKSIVYA